MVTGQTNKWLVGMVKFNDIEIKGLFTLVQSRQQPMGLVYQATKNPSFLKTTQY